MPLATTPTKLSRARLKDVVRGIVLKQGNHFIKDLLRKNGIPIGSTKPDFEVNLNKAIDESALTQPMIEKWLAEVEGWGNQHFYLYQAPTVAATQLAQLLSAPRFKEMLRRSVSYEFPDELVLTAITLTPAYLSMSWHQGKGGWERAADKDYQQQEGLELYEYRAHRKWYDRSVVRFEWRFDDGFAAILLQLPAENNTHAEAMGQVWEDLQEAGIAPIPLTRVKLSAAIKQLGRDTGAAATQAQRMMTEGGHVDLVSTLASGGGIAEVDAVRQVQIAVDDARFALADGTFTFPKKLHAQLSRDIKIHVYGRESRVRIWVQCTREDVYLVIDAIKARLGN